MVTTFVDNKGQKWRRIPARPVDKFFVGVDLGQSVDSTAICVLQHKVTPLPDEDWIVDNAKHTTKERAEIHFDVRHLERLPLGIAYPLQVQVVKDILARPPLSRVRPTLVIDETGVGKAVADIFVQAGLDPLRICIGAGFEANYHGDNRWVVPKTEIISAMDARLHVGELRIAASLQEAGNLAEELKDFRRHVSAAGRATYTARAGKHDDLVLAVGIALWAATKPRRGEFSQGHVRGFF